MNKAESFRKLALAQLGKRYIFGHEVKMDDPNPSAFDCSELVQWLFHRVGFTVPDGSINQYAASSPVGTLLIGDMFFLTRPRVHHVGIYIGAGEVVEAKGRLYGVVKTNLDGIKKRGGVWRRFDGINLGDLASSPRYEVSLSGKFQFESSSPARIGTVIATYCRQGKDRITIIKK